MNLSSLDITLSRIRQIENTIGMIDQKFNGLLNNHTTGSNSFDKILDEKLNEFSPPENEDIKTDKTSSTDEKFNRKELNQLIEKYSRKNNLDKDLVSAVIKAESGFNPKAVSPAGAQGLMQLMPATAKGLGVEDPFDPEQNISGGTKYLSNLIHKYNSVELGLAAYNAGPGSVNKYGGIPPYAETQNYVRKILKSQ
ncbi:MAG TPA: lytic transglycosylase domain-containing protein [Candidatus Gastranaerophilales bacterium]|nr:lytic transglycosylase domain-containing protein [Candidatus Gastranaerophilales bacterium]